MPKHKIGDIVPLPEPIAKRLGNWHSQMAQLQNVANECLTTAALADGIDFDAQAIQLNDDGKSYTVVALPGKEQQQAAPPKGDPVKVDVLNKERLQESAPPSDPAPEPKPGRKARVVKPEHRGA